MKWLTLALFLSSGADLATTEIGLTKPGVSEIHPLMQNRSVRIVSKTAATIIVWQASKRIRGRSSKALIIGMTVLSTYAAYHNLSASRSEDNTKRIMRSGSGLRLSWRVGW